MVYFFLSSPQLSDSYHELPFQPQLLVRNVKSSLNELHNLIAAYGYDAQAAQGSPAHAI